MKYFLRPLRLGVLCVTSRAWRVAERFRFWDRFTSHLWPLDDCPGQRLAGDRVRDVTTSNARRLFGGIAWACARTAIGAMPRLPAVTNKEHGVCKWNKRGRYQVKRNAGLASRNWLGPI